MGKDRRVTHIAILMPDMRGGGAERVCLNLANEFVARGLSVDLVLMRGVGELLPLLDGRVRVVDLAVGRTLGLAWPLRRYLRASRPISLLANMWPLSAIAVLSRILSREKTRVVVVEHTTISRSEIRNSPTHFMALRVSTRILAPCAAARVVVSNGVADDLAKITGIRRSEFVTIYNPIVQKADHLPPSRARGLSNSTPVILNVGTLKAQKDQKNLLRAFAILVAEIDAKLVILGEGELRQELEALAMKLGISDRVSMPGFIRDPSRAYRDASLFVLSSAWEGFGNVLVEALEHGTPVVSTDCPSGPREILGDGRYGALVPVGDPKALALAMKKSLSGDHNYDELISRANEFSVSAAADAYLDLLLPEWREMEVVIGSGADRR